MIERAVIDNLRGRSQTSGIGSLSTVMGFTGTMADLPEGSWAVLLFLQLLEDGSTLHHSRYLPKESKRLSPNMAVSSSPMKWWAIRQGHDYCCFNPDAINNANDCPGFYRRFVNIDEV